MDDVRPDKYTWRAHIFVLPTYHLIIYLFYESATICDIWKKIWLNNPILYIKYFMKCVLMNHGFHDKLKLKIIKWF